MAYAITEYEFWGNPKVREAGKDAVLMYLAGNSYCNQFMTDGLITFAAISTIATLAFQRNPDKSIKSLVDNRLWVEVDGGYRVHDYLKHNKSKEQIEDLINKKSAAGKAGAVSRAQAPARTPEPTPVEQVLNIEHLLPSNSISISKDLKQLQQQPAANVFSVYESEIGVLTGIVRDQLVSAVEDYGADWVIEAIKEAATNNVRKWNYVTAVLKSWKQNGFKVDGRSKRNNSNNGRKLKAPDMGGYEVDHTSEVVIVDNGEAFDGDLQF